jgi:predicted outer membrane protein
MTRWSGNRVHVELLTVAAVLILVAGCGLVSTAADTRPGLGRLPTVDREFVSEAVSGGRMEIVLARHALEAVDRDDVRRLARRLLDDRSRVDAQLVQAARAEGIVLTPRMHPYQRSTVDWITRLESRRFEREYVQLARLDLESIVAECRHEAAAGDDPAMRALAKENLAHLTAERALAGRIARADAAAA